MRHSRCRLPAAVVATLLLAGCTAAGPSAEVLAREAAVTVASADGEPAAVEESVGAEMGDVVETDDVGRAQLTYPDGSLTRLGPDTTFRIVELSTAELQRTFVQLDLGRTWHRVEQLVAEDSAYEVATPVGVAAVRGTEFTVECTDEPLCRIVVLEGTVEFTPTDGDPVTVESFQVLVVPPVDAGELGPAGFPTDAIAADEWLSENVDLDSLELDRSSGSLAGTWQNGDVLLSSGHRPGEVGQTRAVQWEIDAPVCDPLCSSAVLSSTGRTFTVEYLADGYRLAGAQIANCFVPDTGEVIDPEWADIAFAYELQATEWDAEGNPVLLTGTRLDQFTVRADADPRCPDLPGGSEETYEITLSR
ncbi:MAG: Peptidoglycan-binding LysM [Naasia sp.]|nr:Peptidoglycan-binding LysM [Naasia sp.]